MFLVNHRSKWFSNGPWLPFHSKLWKITGVYLGSSDAQKTCKKCMEAKFLSITAITYSCHIDENHSPTYTHPYVNHPFLVGQWRPSNVLYGSSRLFVRKRTRQMDRALYLSLLIIVEGLLYGMIIWLKCAKLWGKGVSSTFPGLWCLWRHQDPLVDPLRVLLACGIL